MLLVIQVRVAHPGELVYAKDAFEPVAARLFFVCDAGSAGVQDPPEGIDIVVFEPEFSEHLGLIFTHAHCPFGWFGRLCTSKAFAARSSPPADRRYPQPYSSASKKNRRGAAFDRIHRFLAIARHRGANSRHLFSALLSAFLNASISSNFCTLLGARTPVFPENSPYRQCRRHAK